MYISREEIEAIKTHFYREMNGDGPAPLTEALFDELLVPYLLENPVEFFIEHPRLVEMDLLNMAEEFTLRSKIVSSALTREETVAFLRENPDVLDRIAAIFGQVIAYCFNYMAFLGSVDLTVQQETRHLDEELEKLLRSDP